MIERNFNLHLTAGHSTALVINVNQFDQGEKWIFTLYNENGTQYIPSTGAIVGIKSDGLGIINSGSVVDGKVVIMETEQMTAAVGKAVFELMIDSQTHGTANFIVLVEPKPGNNADLSESDLSLLQEAIDATSPLPTGGSVGQVLTKTANGSTWSDAGTPTQEQVADAVSDWADEHITVSTGVVIDTSLAVAGAAADAKKTGDEITDLKSAFDSITVPYANTSIWEQGAIDVSNGNNAASSVRVRTGVVPTSIQKIKIETGYSCGIYCWNGDTYEGSWTGSGFSKTLTTWKEGTVDLLSLSAYKIKLALKNSAGTSIDISAAENVLLLTFTDQTIEKLGVPADSKAVKDELSKKADLESVFGTDYEKQPIPLQKVVGVYKFPSNLVDPVECVNNYYVNTTNGELNGGASYFSTGYISVIGGTTYRANLGRNLAWYNSSKTYISGASGTGIQSGVTAPENAAFIRFTINKTSDGTSNPFDVYFTDTTQYNDKVHIDNLEISDDFIPHPWCYGKSLNWIGDSIVDGQDFDEEVCTALNLTKLTTDGVDGGINGSTIALNGDGTNIRHALCLRYSSMPNNADIIAVSAGTNDWMYAWCPIGTINDPDDGTSNTTFYGALKTLCKGLIDKYPQKVIFFTTPIKRGQAFESGNGGEYTADGVPTTPFSKNKYGQTLMDYADIIKEVCGYYSIPVLDMYRESLLNPHIASQQGMFDNVLTHPSVTGQKIMARRVCGWITQLGYEVE